MRHFGEYPANWPEVANAIKEAAGWRCERCHHPDEPPWKIGGSRTEQWNRLRDPDMAGDGWFQTGRSPCDDLCTHPQTDPAKQRMLTVHHLDLDKSNVEDWNLAALCQGCHLSVQGRVDMHQEYVFAHTDWMKPHVAGRDAAMAAGTWPREAQP